MQTCQVLWSKLGVVDHGVDLGAKRVEGPLEGRGDCTERRQRGRQTWAQKTVVNAGEEQGDTEAEVGDAVAKAVGQPLDQAVHSEAAKLIGHGTLPDGFGMAVVEVSQMVTQLGSAKALWQEAEKDQGMS